MRALGQARRVIERTVGQAKQRVLYGRPFSGRTSKRLLLLSLPERIPQSQIYPFHYFGRHLNDVYGVEVREVSIDRYLTLEGRLPRDATTVCFQTPFDIEPDRLHAVINGIRTLNSSARLVYLDWFAPTDLRLANLLYPHVDYYIKKHVLRDRSLYKQATLGDTNLMDFYCRRFGLTAETILFPVPDGFFDKLIVGPSFATADFMIQNFHSGRMHNGPRPIDLHARLGVAGTPWYQAMRAECARSIVGLKGLNIVSEFGVPHSQYLGEIARSKICFSPFGYGEVCWRDFEAVAGGAVILKPDMSHIETQPDIFIARDTYAPVRWDLSDLGDCVDELISSPELRQRMTSNAFDVLNSYFRNDGFSRQLERILN